MTPPLLSFFGDDFTGSTDALESLELAGIRTVLFTQPPDTAELARHPDLRAFGIAGQTRSMPPDAMRAALLPAFAAMRQAGAAIAHYKVCSTFDSAPHVGSIGCAIDTGAEVFDQRVVPVVAGTPSLGRYCIFGNLFARLGQSREVYRIDHHPSMSRHPVTPMDEADLRVHLGRQTTRRFGLVDLTMLARPVDELQAMLDDPHIGAMLIDMARDTDHVPVGRLLDAWSQHAPPRFVVGSSAVGSSLAAHWQSIGRIGEPPTFLTPQPTPTLVISGSCSPVTITQVDRASVDGFDVLDLRADDEGAIARAAIEALVAGRSVVVHSNAKARIAEIDTPALRQRIAVIARTIVEAGTTRRLLVAGGDTSGDVARSLKIQSIRMIAPLVRGAPLCVAVSQLDAMREIEVVFKGGQIGSPGFFDEVRRGCVGGMA